MNLDQWAETFARLHWYLRTQNWWVAGDSPRIDRAWILDTSEPTQPMAHFKAQFSWGINQTVTAWYEVANKRFVIQYENGGCRRVNYTIPAGEWLHGPMNMDLLLYPRNMNAGDGTPIARSKPPKPQAPVPQMGQYVYGAGGIQVARVVRVETDDEYMGAYRCAIAPLKKDGVPLITRMVGWVMVGTITSGGELEPVQLDQLNAAKIKTGPEVATVWFLVTFDGEKPIPVPVLSGTNI